MAAADELQMLSCKCHQRTLPSRSSSQEGARQASLSLVTGDRTGERRGGAWSKATLEFFNLLHGFSKTKVHKRPPTLTDG